jgi:Sigma-54 interaction domain
MEYPNPVCQAQFIQKSSSQRHLPAKAPGNPNTLAQILQAQILSGSSLLCNWLHSPQETGIRSRPECGLETHSDGSTDHSEILGPQSSFRDRGWWLRSSVHSLFACGWFPAAQIPAPVKRAVASAGFLAECLPPHPKTGHEKGAFTGAISQKIGRLELADQGVQTTRFPAARLELQHSSASRVSAVCGGYGRESREQSTPFPCRFLQATEPWNRWGQLFQPVAERASTLRCSQIRYPCNRSARVRGAHLGLASRRPRVGRNTATHMWWCKNHIGAVLARISLVTGSQKITDKIYTHLIIRNRAGWP